jgi:hypothetical protein
MGSKLTPIGAVARGLMAGAVGTLAMDLIWYARHRGEGGTTAFADWETAGGLDDWENAPAPAQVGKRLVEGLVKRELKAERARLTTNVVHWTYGMLWGAAYGIVVGSTRKPRTMYGLLFGPLVWSTAYVALPPTGIYKPMREYDAKTLWKDASAHLAFGLGTSAAYRVMAGRGWS